MGIIGRKPITAPLWVKVAIALAAAAMLTLLAFLLTLDTSGNVGGKVAITGAILVLPMVVAAKSGWSPNISLAFAFVTYLVVCLLAVWLLTREKHPH